MKKNTMVISILSCLLAAGVFLAGCDSGSSSSNNTPDTEKKFRVTIVNLTANQPFSPVAVVLHGEGYSPWVIGQAAPAGLEQLAEGGNTDPFIVSADTDQDVMDTVSGTAPVGMGAKDMFEVTTRDNSNTYLSLATMLVNTNDAFAGISSMNIDNLAVGVSSTLFVNALDAGTEANSEALSDIPGPVAGGEGFNAVRDDQDIISIHPGVVTADDGLLTSTLDESHRWDNPVAKITVMRIE